MASVGQLAAAVAHEANNPLAYVIANLSFVQQRIAELDGPDIAAARPALEEALAESRQGADRVRQIVRDLKTFARAEEEEQGPQNIAHIMDSTLKMAATEIRHRAKLEKRYAEAPLVVANEGRLAQVFLNLVVNAAQAIAEGHADENEIRVRTSVDGRGQVVVDIADTGPGIPPEKLNEIFDPFFTTKKQGMGIGLSIARTIVQAHKGRIWAENQSGGGAVFRLTLPLAVS